MQFCRSEAGPCRIDHAQHAAMKSSSEICQSRAHQQDMPLIPQSTGPAATARLGEHACLNIRRKRPHSQDKASSSSGLATLIHQRAARRDSAIVPEMWSKPNLKALGTENLLSAGRQASQGEIRGECCVQDLARKHSKRLHTLEQSARRTCCLDALFRHMMLDAGRTVRLQNQLSEMLAWILLQNTFDT